MVRMPIPTHDQNTSVFVGREVAHLSLNVGGRFDWSIVVLLGVQQLGLCLAHMLGRDTRRGYWTLVQLPAGQRGC
jgi:hypothetical protein